MTLRVRETRVARSLILDHAEYIAKQGQPGAADRLLIKYSQLLDVLAQWPRAGHRFETDAPRLKDIRVLAVSGYALQLYYQVQPDQVTVLATIHGSMHSHTVRRILAESQR